MSDEEEIAALVIDNGSGMCKGKKKQHFVEEKEGRGTCETRWSFQDDFF